MKRIAFLSFSLISSLVCLVPSVEAKEILLSTELKSKKPITVSSLNPNDETDQKLLAQAREVFVKSFQDAYKNFSAEDLYITNPSRDYLIPFLEIGFNSEEKDFNAKKEGALFVVAQEQKTNRVIAFVSYDVVQLPDCKRVYIRQLAVDPDEAYKHQGLGRILCMDTIRKIVQDQPAKVVVASRKINDSAIHFYHKLGYSDVSMDEIPRDLNPIKYCGFKLMLNSEKAKIINEKN